MVDTIILLQQRKKHDNELVQSGIEEYYAGSPRLNPNQRREGSWPPIP
jgi:hypothetical protein